jgi:hypothetical protein
VPMTAGSSGCWTCCLLWSWTDPAAYQPALHAACSPISEPEETIEVVHHDLPAFQHHSKDSLRADV